MSATPGPWVVVNDGTDDEPMTMVKAARVSGKPPRHCVAICATGDSPQAMENANARLIAEAGTVYNETGLTPRQLAEQRKELLDALNGMLEHAEWSTPQARDAFNAASRAIAKADAA